MKTETFHLELITPCFCGGAEPDQQAEIRAPSIRGQLRWWFRTLGGFQSLAPMLVRDQEAMIFGSTAGEQGMAGSLVVRCTPAELQAAVRDGQELGHRLFSHPAYLTFPVQSREKGGQKTSYAGRGVILSGRFQLVLQWRSIDRLWPELLSLVSVFGNLGAMGFRSRRAMGALAFTGVAAAVPPLKEALQRFPEASQPLIAAMNASGGQDAISKLGAWLRKWRAHGRTQDHAANLNDPNKPPHNAGFPYAQRDHDIGYGLTGVTNQPAFRPALGLPIVQRIQGGTNNWEWGWNAKQKRAEGRFASPVLLRPHKDARGSWHALVIFVDAHRWPDGKKVYLNGQERDVSLELYEAMKHDPALHPFP